MLASALAVRASRRICRPRGLSTNSAAIFLAARIRRAADPGDDIDPVSRAALGSRWCRRSRAYWPQAHLACNGIDIALAARKARLPVGLSRPRPKAVTARE